MEFEYVFRGIVYADNGTFPKGKVTVKVREEDVPESIGFPFIDLVLPMNAARLAQQTEQATREECVALARRAIQEDAIRQWVALQTGPASSAP